jgi:ferritin
MVPNLVVMGSTPIRGAYQNTNKSTLQNYVIMSIKSNVQGALIAQMNREFYSRSFYLSMASYFESVGLKGFAHWMVEQSVDEDMRGMMFYNYLVKRGARATIGALDAPPAGWSTPLGAFEHALTHKQELTEKINELMSMALAEKDYATVEILREFVQDQVDKEENMSQIIFKIQLASTEKGAALLYDLDKELGKRGEPIIWNQSQDQVM